MFEIAESDWRLMRKWEQDALNALCAEINAGAQRIIQDSQPGLSDHERFRRLFSHILDRNKDIAHCFNGLRRSTAVEQLLFWRKHGLLKDGQIAQFTPGLQALLADLQAWGRGHQAPNRKGTKTGEGSE